MIFFVIVGGLLLGCLGFSYWLEWWKWNAEMADKKNKEVAK